MSDHPFAYYDPTHDKLLWAEGPQYVHAQRTEGMSLKPLYLHPPTRLFMRLSDKEIEMIMDNALFPNEIDEYDIFHFARSVEDALDEKNK